MNSFVENVNYVANLDNKYGSGIELYKNNISLKSVQHDIELKFSYYNNDDKKIHSIVHLEPGVLVGGINDTLLSFKTLVESSITGSEFTCTVSSVVQNFVINNIVMVNINIVSNNNTYKTYELEMKVVTAGAVTYYVFGEVKDSLKILPSLAMITTSDIDAMVNVYEIQEEVITVASNIVGLNSIVYNMPEILLADDNAAIATTKALESSDSAESSLQSATDAAASAARALSSATTATTKESEALVSANNAATSATNASMSETQSANSAGQSATSASSADNSAGDASASAIIASTQAEIAATKANEASVSANSALVSKNDASSSATIALNSSSNAGISEVNASNSAISASNSASAASISETNAGNSEDIAITKAGEALTSANSASSSEANALVSKNSASTSANTATAQATIAVTKASEAVTSADNALASENKSEKWATEVEDVTVEPGKYSAMHWAIKADSIVNVVNDQVTNATNTYSSNKIQSMHYAQATAIANLASSSATIGSSVSQVIPEEPSVFSTLVWDNITESSNSNIFELGSSSFVFKKNGVYNFFNSLDIYRIGSGAILTITFELYDADTGTTVMSAGLPIDMQSGTKQVVPFNVLLEIDDVSTVPKTIKVRMRSTSASGSIELYTFNSILSLSSVSSTANVDTLDDALGALITGVLI